MEIKELQIELHNLYFRDRKKAKEIKISPKEFDDLASKKDSQFHIGINYIDKDEISYTFDGVPLIITNEVNKFVVR